MISSYDDFPIHQAAVPINQPGPSDRNFYDRYWFNGHDDEGAFVFEAGFGLYPNRFVMDGHFSVVVDGVQHSFHGSRRAPKERADQTIGPLSVEVVKPMRVVRVRLAPNETGIECDLVFEARSAPTEEPKNIMYDDGHLIMENSRFTQFGRWSGYFSVAGVRTEVNLDTTRGTRDRSWGVRPIGEPQGGAPGKLSSDPGVYWVWAPVCFDDIATQFGTFEDFDGNATQLSAVMAPIYGALDDIPFGEEPGHREMANCSHKIHWKKGTRWAESAEVRLETREGEVYELTYEPMIRILMLGVGYQHPEWGHGFWKGDLAIHGESWVVDEVDPLFPFHLHNHSICKVTMGDRKGIATLETICIGRHAPSGFRELFDGAA